MISERTMRVLEFTRIREMLAEGALTEAGAEKCRTLVPMDDLAPVMDAQAETEMPPAYYRPAPMYAPQPVSPPRQDDKGFYAVQPDLYEERFTEPEPEKQPIPEPEWRKEPVREEPVEPVQEQAPPEPDKPGMFGSFLNRLKTAKPEKKAAEPQPPTSPPPKKRSPQSPKNRKKKFPRFGQNPSPRPAPRRAPPRRWTTTTISPGTFPPALCPTQRPCQSRLP